MGWKNYIVDGPADKVLPWFGFRAVHDAKRSWNLFGNCPPEHGWYVFSVNGGRAATLASQEPVPPDPDWARDQPKLRGYVVGDRFIPDTASVVTDPKRLVEQTLPLYCVELGRGRFARARVVKDREGNLVYMGQEFPQGADAAALRAYEDRCINLDHLKGVTPPLDLAFRWVSYQRAKVEAHRAELERRRLEEERIREENARVQKLIQESGDAIGRRSLAEIDFPLAAKAALQLSGAELLDTQESYRRGEMIVRYRFQQRRLECTVDKRTLRVVDAGVCLTDHNTGEKGDTLFTLESLPGVIAEAINLGKLVVWRGD